MFGLKPFSGSFPEFELHLDFVMPDGSLKRRADFQYSLEYNQLMADMKRVLDEHAGINSTDEQKIAFLRQKQRWCEKQFLKSKLIGTLGMNWLFFDWVLAMNSDLQTIVNEKRFGSLVVQNRGRKVGIQWSYGIKKAPCSVSLDAKLGLWPQRGQSGIGLYGYPGLGRPDVLN